MECGQMGNEASIPALVSPNALQLVTFEILQAPVCRRLHSEATLWPCVPGSPRMLLRRLLHMPPHAPGGSRMPSRFRSGFPLHLGIAGGAFRGHLTARRQRMITTERPGPGGGPDRLGKEIPGADVCTEATMKRFLIVLLVNAQRYWNQWGKAEGHDADVEHPVTPISPSDATQSECRKQRGSEGGDPRHDADVEHPVTPISNKLCTPLLLQESSSINKSERTSEREDLVIPRKAVQLGLLPEPVAAAEDRMGELAMVEPGRTVLWVRGHQPSRARR
jgi:hypothetical protein